MVALSKFPEASPASEDKLSPTGWLCMILGFCLILVDGYDNYAISYAAPYIIKEWQIANPAVMGEVFSAGLAGAVFGALAGGYAGDRFGRRPVVVACCLLMAIPTALIPFVRTLDEMSLLRFFVGLGMGGLHPLVMSLVSEYIPARSRAKLLTIMFSGITVGAALAGAAGAWLAPLAGWRSMFVIGGVAAMAMGLISLWILPESPAFLARKGEERKAAAERLPGTSGPAVAGSGAAAVRIVPALFEGRLLIITPLLWILVSTLLLSNFAIGNWLPTLLGTLERGPSMAATFGMTFLVSGTLGGLVLSPFVDKGRLKILAWMIAAAIVSVALIGIVEHDILLYLLVFIAGFTIMGVGYCVNAICAMVYPPHARSTGVGFYFVVGRLVGTLGPLAVSLGLYLGLGPTQSLSIICIPLMVSLLGTIALMRYRDAIYEAGSDAMAAAEKV